MDRQKRKRLLKKILIAAVVLLAAHWCFEACTRVMADKVTVTYVANMRSLGRTFGDNQVSSKDSDVIKEWIDLMEKIDRRDLRTDDRTLDSTGSFPCYLVEFRQGRILMASITVTRSKVAVSSWFWGGHIVDYSFPNPYFDEISDRMAELKADRAESMTDDAELTRDEAIPQFELSDAFRALLDEVNAAHEAVKLYDGEYQAYTARYEEPDFQFSMYNHMPATSPGMDTVLTLEQITEDMELYYKALRTQYGAYDYFGGDEAFRQAIDAIIADCAAMETVTCGGVRDSMSQHLNFVEDAHFSFGGRRLGEFPVPFFFRNVAYEKTKNGYEAHDGRVVASVDGYAGLDDLFKISMTKEGDLVYYPILLEGFPFKDLLSGAVTCSTPTLTVRYTDGSVDELTTSPYTMPSSAADTETVEIHEENGIPVVAASLIAYQYDASKLIESATEYQNRDIVIMDLRMNNGGDFYAVPDWVSAYAQQPVWGNALYLRDGEPVSQYETFKDEDEEFVSMDKVNIVLTSKWTASGGEMFIDMAYNMENTLVVGENTRGWLTASIDAMTLPNSGMYVSFGDVLILHPDNSPFKEYQGFYPDVWVPQAEAEEAVMNFIAKNTTVK